MPVVSPGKVIAVQKDTKAIRNICILAHVDHGKTSLSDSLLASNGIISQKLAGKVRYLDSREDEQTRGITMESSAISLYYTFVKQVPAKEAGAHAGLVSSEHIINLIDSPGHIDFSSEVSTASRLCDGALVLLDVVEGVCSQTITVLRQVWLERIKPILVFNKLDRLITELKLSTFEAFQHLNKLLEQVNAVVGSFYQGDRMAQDLKRREDQEESNSTDTQPSTEEQDDENIYFEPARRNVIFASAADGWAFSIDQFATFYAQKLGMKSEALEKVLWGDFYLDTKAKRVLTAKQLKGRSFQPTFVSFVLDNIWAVYNSTIIERDQEKVEKIIKTLGLRIHPRDLKSKDPKALLTAIFSQWLPLSTAVLVTVIEQIPSPAEAQAARFPALLAAEKIDASGMLTMQKALTACSSNANDPVIAYVSKMFSIPHSDLPRNEQKARPLAPSMRPAALANGVSQAKPTDAALSAENDVGFMEPIDSTSEIGQAAKPEIDEESEVPEEDERERESEHLIGFSRLYSGTIKVGQKLYVYGPKYNPHSPSKFVHEFTVSALYLIMGREMISLDQVPAGNVFGIGGLEGCVLKNATISSLSPGINLAGVQLNSDPIVRVALEAVNPQEMPKLVEGLRLLNQADSCVQILTQESGEHVILTAGELHLERCLKDLRDRFAKIEIQASKPIVPFRETIIHDHVKDKAHKRGTASASISSGEIFLEIQIVPLPTAVTEYLIQHRQTIDRLEKGDQPADEGREEDDVGAEIVSGASESLKELTLEDFRQDLVKAFEAEGQKDIWKDVISKFVDRPISTDLVDTLRICSFGPRRSGPNILVDNSSIGLRRLLTLQQISTGDDMPSVNRNIENNLITAFQISTSQGPLCAEPVQGVACIVQKMTLNLSESAESRSGIYSGQIISSFREMFKIGFLEWSPRLMLATYSCDIQASAEVLGKVYGVIQRRRGRIVAEEMKEGTPFFTITALLPVIESFGFADDIRKKTSGAASPQLIFIGFISLDEDPFWVPATEEELEDLGELAERENVAKRYIDSVRRRKGLFVEEKIIKNAEKQRTLKR